MNNIFLYLKNEEIAPNLSETARYLGYKKSTKPDENIQKLIKKAAEEMHKLLKPQAVFEIFPLKIEANSPNLNKNQSKMSEFDEFSQKNIRKITFADMTILSADLGNNLENCTEVALLGATIGPQVDAYIRRATATDPAYASICQATGAMYIEKVVDKVNAEIKKYAESNGKTTRPRYSPGYGDVPLEIQKDFFRLLNCSRIGLTLMDTLIMAPEKSVTAFVGIK